MCHERSERNDTNIFPASRDRREFTRMQDETQGTSHKTQDTGQRTKGTRDADAAVHSNSHMNAVGWKPSSREATGGLCTK